MISTENITKADAPAAKAVSTKDQKRPYPSIEEVDDRPTQADYGGKLLIQ